ncbi:non-ribosomal peptide synthetase [Lactovum miscens]|uniref:Amino acid adenylation domain-containing protein n=1 Tax=Lactovum miscens TaxID=190387 RepID=A0A841C7E2_9LACT|nr:AMP-binding protein [Lactovum miscens]MBB5888264.1 amino acid adenylation domain-containing protein [Lactovum miscens]
MKILEHLRQRVVKNPDEICIVSPEVSFTFKQLDQYSDKVAEYISELSQEDIVPLYIKNDFYVLPIIIGIMKLGKVPLPLTTSLVFEQSILRIEDVEYDLVVLDEQISTDGEIGLKSKILVLPNAFQDYAIKKPFIAKESEIAYIISTSGSTGTPKKVFLTQQNISWILEEFYSVVNFNSQSKFLFTTPYTFDVSLTELFSPIFKGGRLYCFSHKLKNVEKMKSTLEYIEAYGITHMSLSPTYAELLVDISSEDKFKRLKYLCLAGENFGIGLAHKLSGILKQGTQILNLYGPSETTIYATYYQITGKELTEIPIGRGFNGCKIKVLDDNKKGQGKGELYIGGSGVTKGYLLQPDLSREKFVQIDSEIYYRTGDFVHYDVKGNLVFETRRDNQVQVNGIRVELGEIENCVLNFKTIKSCKCVYEGKRIYVFYQIKNPTEGLKAQLKESIPQYINPILIEVSEFIVNQNRKFDVKQMIQKYYPHTTLSEKSFVEKELELILRELEIASYEEMDSLDTVRFFVEVEDRFKIKIDDDFIPSLSKFYQVITLVDEKLKTLEKNPYLSKEYSDIDTFESTNLEFMVHNYFRQEDLENRLIPTLYMQKHYDSKPASILSFNANYSDFSYDGLKKIEHNLVLLAKKIDVLRMILIQEESGLYFKKVKKDRFIPVIYATNSIINEKTIKKILYGRRNALQFLVIACPFQKKITAYFSHYIIDKSSLFKLSKIFTSFLDNNNIKLLSEPYERFIHLIKAENEKISIDELMKLIPETTCSLPSLREIEDDRVLVMESELVSKKVVDVINEAIYKFAQYIFSIDGSLQKLTGSMITNIREFYEFDGADLIGDMHSTIPFQINLNQSFLDFDYSVDKTIKKYQEGLNIRDKIFEGYPEFYGKYGEAKNKWDALGISVNYIGEIKSVNDTIRELREANFNKKYIIVFTHKSKLYQIMFNNRLIPYNFDLVFQEKTEGIIVRDYFENLI